MTSHIHRMPFGAEVRADGSTLFRLWAPAAQRVEIALESGGTERRLAMQARGDGWFEYETRDAGPGSLYAYHIDDGQAVPDPASRFQPRDVHGPSLVVDPAAFAWADDDWHGRPWEEAVFYELHPGTFSPEGTFRGIAERLDYLADLGVTAVELMPVADFPGRRNWGYDGVLPFAPDATYGEPRDLKALVEAAHQRGLMVFLDVVYNHFGPEGNYLHLYAPQFFTERHQTPWGAAINFDDAGSRTVRDFFIHNALFWLEEYRFDGLRLDAVHAIADESEPHILVELAEAVRNGPGRTREVHLVLENEHNEARFLQPGLEHRDDGRPRWYNAQWNDDFHHAEHLLATGESDGYYIDYADRPAALLGRCLAEGFAYQGDPSRFKQGAPRGEPSGHLPPLAFVTFLQNHDQVGNRALGERIGALTSPEALRALTAVLLLAPSPPMLFMGQELLAESPFLFFCEFGPDLAQAVTEGRRREFARFERFADPKARETIPDPNDPATFLRSKLDWNALERAPHAQWRAFHRDLLLLRRREIVPRLGRMRGGTGRYEHLGAACIRVTWTLGDASRLTLYANLCASEHRLADKTSGAGALYQLPEAAGDSLARGLLPPWSVVWILHPGDAEK